MGRYWYAAALILGVSVSMAMLPPAARAQPPLKFGWSPDDPCLADFNGALGLCQTLS